MADSPTGSSIMDLVLDVLDMHPSGIRAEELCDELKHRRLEFALLTSDSLERILSRRSHLFVRTDDGRWIRPKAALREMVAAALDPAPDPARSSARPSRDYVVFDVEATSRDPASAELLQIAAVRLNQDLDETDRFSERLIRPTQEISQEVASLTGIRNEDVQDAA